MRLLWSGLAGSIGFKNYRSETLDRLHDLVRFALDPVKRDADAVLGLEPKLKRSVDRQAEWSENAG